MTRWITGYIDENSKRWRKEKQERQENEVKLAEDWKRMNRFDRIRVIKDTREENRTVNIKLRTPKLHQAEQQRGDQAEQPIQDEHLIGGQAE